MLDSHSVFSFAVKSAKRARSCFTYVSEDLAKAFDSISPAQAVAILLHPGLRSRVASIIMAFYLASKRIFALDGAVSAAWVSITRSL